MRGRAGLHAHQAPRQPAGEAPRRSRRSRSSAFTATARRRSAPKRSPASRAASTGCWSPPTSRRAASTSPRSATSSTSTCRWCPRTTSTASAARRAPKLTGCGVHADGAGGRGQHPRDRARDQQPAAARDAAGFRLSGARRRRRRSTSGRRGRRGATGQAGGRRTASAARRCVPARAARRRTDHAAPRPQQRRSWSGRAAPPSSMSEPAYPAARIVAPKSARALRAARAGGAAPRARGRGGRRPMPTTIEALIDAAFWASLRREETYVPKISLAFLDAGGGDAPDDVRAAAAARARRARQGGAGGGAARHSPRRVPAASDGLSVWGTVRAIPFLCFVVEVAAPGLLVVKHHRGDETGKFVNVAVIEGDQIKIVDEAASSLPDCPPLLTSLLGFDSPASWTVGARLGERARAAGGVDAGAWPRRAAPGRAARQRRSGRSRWCGRSRTRSSPAFRGARAAHARAPRTRRWSGRGRTRCTARWKRSPG